MTININLNNYAVNVDGSKNFNYPNGDKPQGQVELAWDRPDQYTNADKLMPKTFVISYGTSQGGPYTNEIDMSNDNDPGMLQRVIDNLSAGTTYYFVMQTVDSEGFVSAQSSELSLVATVPSTTSDPETFTEIRQADLPYTINSSGNYRIMENLSYDGTAGITLAANDVVLFAASNDNITYTVSNSQSTNGIQITGQRSNFECYGFTIKEGGHLHTSGTSHGHIFFDNLGNAVTGLDIHHMTLEAGLANIDYTSSSTGYGCISFLSPVGSGVQGSIRDCTFILKGSKTQSGIRGVFVEDNDPDTNLKVYNCTFNISDMPSTPNGYIRGIMGVQEAYGNTFNVQNIDVTQNGVVGIYQTEYTHNNTFNVINACATRCILQENDYVDSVHLYNDLNIISTTGSGGVRLYRCRFGANGSIFGFSTASGGGAANALALLDIYGTQVQYGDTRDTYVYHNTVDGMQNGLINVAEQVENTYVWSNTADNTNVYGVFLRSISSGENANGLYFDGDSIEGATADIRLLTSGAFPAVENTHFSGLGALNISNNDPVNTIAETHYWVDGNAGLVTHNKRNTGARIPNAPINLRAA